MRTQDTTTSPTETRRAGTARKHARVATGGRRQREDILDSLTAGWNTVNPAALRGCRI